ncbi:MAG: hypothetical protein KAT43_01540 [Nanoarchaeota archaeon]|nr:hypothetical protein [Nanoarchaeota archaeon]
MAGITIKKGKGVVRRIRNDPSFLRKSYRVGSIKVQGGGVVPFVTPGDFKVGDKVAFETSADGMVRRLKKI